MTKDVKEWFAMEPCRIAKIFVDRHCFTLKILKKLGDNLALGGRQVHS